MKYVNLGNTDIKVSKMCLGCMGFGDANAGMHSWTLPYNETKEIIKYALSQGVNFFDTAAAYQGGTSEQYLGQAIKELTNREDVVIATKFLPKNNPDLSQRDYIYSQLEGSLKRLQTDYIDLYILHSWDEVTPIEETMEILNELVESKKVRAIGISNCYAWQIAKANEIAKNKGWATFQTIQGHYNLIFREEEREMKPYCDLHNISLTPYSALAAGRLSKKPGETSKRLKEDTFAMGKYDASKEVDDKIIKRVEHLSQIKGCTMTEIALAWLYTKVASPVVGATKVHHIDGAVNACDIELSKEDINYLEELYIPHEIVGIMKKK